MKTVVLKSPLTTPDPVAPLQAVAVYAEPAGPPLPEVADGVEVLLPDEDDKSKHRNKRTKQQREEDLAMIARMITNRKTHNDMMVAIANAREYTLSKSQIRFDIREVENRWKLKQSKSIPVSRAIEVEFIKTLEAEALNAWHASKEPTQKSKVEEGKDGKKVTREVERVHGDPAYLAVLAKFIDLRIKITGIAAAIKQDVTVDARVEHSLATDRMREAYRKKMSVEVALANARQIHDVKAA